MTDYQDAYPIYALPIEDESRYNKVHDKLGKFANQIGASGVGSVVVDGKTYKPGDTYRKDGMTYKVMTQEDAIAFLNKTPAKPPAIKTAPKSTVGAKTAVKEPVALPKKRGGTQPVKDVKDPVWTTRKEYDRKVPRKLSKDEEAAVLEYDDPVGAHYMNWTARFNGDFPKVPIASEPGKAVVRRTAAQTKQHSANLSAAIQRHRTPHDLMLSRRVGASAFGASDHMDSNGDFVPKAVGSVLQDKGFVSATLLKDVAEHHPMFATNAPVKMNIRVPKGTPALSLGTKVEEVLLDQNTKIAILSATKGQHTFKRSGKTVTWWEVEAQVVP